MIYKTKQEWFYRFWYPDYLVKSHASFLKVDWLLWRNDKFGASNKLLAPEVLFDVNMKGGYTLDDCRSAVVNFLKANLVEPYLTEYLSLDLIDKL